MKLLTSIINAMFFMFLSGSPIMAAAWFLFGVHSVGMVITWLLIVPVLAVGLSLMIRRATRRTQNGQSMPVMFCSTCGETGSCTCGEAGGLTD